MKRSPLGRGGAGARAFVDRGRASSAQSLRSNKPSGETRACAICGSPFYARRREIDQGGGRFCSRACFVVWQRSPEQRAAASETHRRRPDLIDGARAGEANPNYRHGRDVKRHSRTGHRRFQSGQTVCQHQSCITPTARIDQHHVVYEQEVLRQHGDQWHPDNALGLCLHCHHSHHGRGRVLLLTRLRDENLDFAAALFGTAAYDYLKRYYGGDDPRVDCILVDGPEWRERLVRLYPHSELDS